MAGKFQKLSSKVRIYMLIVVVAAVCFVFFGMKNAGSVYFEGHQYEAGSLFQPEEYSHSGLGTSFDDKTFGGNAMNELWGDPKDLNGQIKQLRRKNLPIVIISGAVVLLVGFMTWKEKEFKDFLVENR